MLAGRERRRDTANMDASARRALLLTALCALALPATLRGDEIRLKDGKKLYGVIVAYEDNMFKVKTDFGFVLVEKDKIASIIPTTPAQPKPEPQPAAKKEPPKPAPATIKAESKESAQPKAEPAVESAKEMKPPSASKAQTNKREKEAAIAAKASIPAPRPAPTLVAAPAPATKTVPATITPTTSAAAIAPPAAPPAPPKEPEPPPNREEVQGNTYINYTHGFRMYKAPSWSVMDDARRALPNAIVAMGTSSESTLMVIGREKTKDTLESAASTFERRLHDAYVNYRRLEEKKMQVGGMPAIEYRYRGTADDHDWSGTLVVVARGTDIFTILGMTYADTDLIQIQENVIARAIASMDFSH